MAAVDGACLLRFAPDGRLIDRVELPVEKPSKPAFGGTALGDLYVTSLRRNLVRPIEDQPHAGGVFRLDVGAAGVAMPDSALEVAQRAGPG
jgi:sugar lactone lactonase YvrE